MARALDYPVDPQWAEIAQNMDPLPTDSTDAEKNVHVLAGNYSDLAAGCKPSSDKDCQKLNNGNCGTRSSGGCCCGAQPAGSMDVGTW